MVEKKLFVLFLIFFTIYFAIGEDEVKILDDRTFEHLTQASTGATTGDWLVFFCKEHAPGCRKLEKVFKKLHSKYKHKMTIAKVLSSSKLTVRRFQVTKWPAIILFHHGQQYFYTDTNHGEQALSKFIENFQKFPNQKVAEPITMLDVIVEDLMDDAKHIIHLRKNAAILIFCSGILFGCILMQVLKIICQLFQGTGTSEEAREEQQEEEKKKTK